MTADGRSPADRFARYTRGTMRVHAGMSLHDALKIARELGCEVTWPSASGEVRVAHPTWTTHVNANSRKKDASRELVKRLRKLEAWLSREDR